MAEATHGGHEHDSASGHSHYIEHPHDANDIDSAATKPVTTAGHGPMHADATDHASNEDGYVHAPVPIAADSHDSAKHLLVIKSGDGINLPSTYVEIAHPMANSNGSLKGKITLLLDMSAEAALLDNVLTGAAATVLCLFLLAAAGPAWSYRSTLKAKKTADEKVHFLAAHDSLTGLLNRSSFVPLLEDSLSRQAGFALFFIDVDNFKYLNDTFGHETGDIILKTIALRLRKILGEKCLIARLGGDEFAAIQPDIGDLQQLDAQASRMVKELRNPIAAGGHSVVTSVSIGSAIAPQDGDDAIRLMKSADLAMYQAKAEGRDCNCHFEPWMDQKLAARREIESRLQWAVVNNGFELHYQPLHSSEDNALIGFEALLRLKKEDGTPIGPDQFIPIAEETHLIEKVGQWVLMRSCEFAAKWPNDLKLAVNLSGGQFKSGNLHAHVSEALKASGLDPARLELEITESLLIDDSKSNLEQLQRLKDLGVSIAMDDFGTGYSSLSYLWQFPFDKIKIDRSFMSGFENQTPQITRILETIIGLGHTLDMEITAEGVETSEQLKMLQEIRCDQIQGYLLGRPQSEAATIHNILQHKQKLAPQKEIGITAVTRKQQ
ncbi:putative bifunctional diguanylate cyclase/phosphodiesterase [Roseibium sediminis]|uniref:putative bifunctional diguanylate cyclase/phosphodiesterase n=1 Tax=Roseibium sediminis TaxID=1775174 RepID=UPI0013757615|nr:EAL domain-containing protein [Roseibium sediminis]